MVDKNTCSKFGYIAGPARTAAHLDRMFDTIGARYFRLVPGVSRPSGYTGGSERCILAKAKAGTTSPGECPNWKAVDGGQWFMRGTTMLSSGWRDPDGDYCPDTLLPLRSYRSISAGTCIDPSNKAYCTNLPFP